MKSFILSLITLYSISAWSLGVPSLSRPIEDLAKVMTEDQKLAVEKDIRDLHSRGLVQVSVLIIPSLEGENLESYSMSVAEKWKLGTEKKDNGLLILIAMREKKIRVEVGNGIEGEITDAYSRRIIDGMKSGMRSQNYQAAIGAAVSMVKEKMEYSLPENVQSRKLQEEERLRQEEEARIENEKQKQEIMEFLSVALPVGVGALGVLFLIFSFNGGELQKIKTNIVEQTKKNKMDKEDFEAKQRTLDSMSVDKEKASFLQTKASLDNYRRLLSQKRQELSSMKSYVGDK